MKHWVIFAVKLALVAFVVLLGVHPRWRLSRFMFKSRGPRSDVVFLTRRQLFAEGAKYLYLAVLGIGVIWVAGSVGEALGGDAFATTVGAAALFIVGILSAMFILGGAYLLVRGLFRSPRYVPPSQG
jgi:hypothetical protein